MSATLYKKVDYSLAKLIEDIDLEKLACPISSDHLFGMPQKFVTFRFYV